MPAADERREARDLRAYLRRRRDGRRMPERLRYVPVLRQRGRLPEVRAGLAARADDEGDIRPVRKEGQPWCPWLGSRASVAQDAELQALFRVWEAEENAAARWRRAYERSRSRRGAERLLAELRASGQRALDVARARVAGRPSGQPRPSGGALAGVGVPAFD